MTKNKLPPGPKGHWLFGSLKEYQNDVFQLLLDSVQNYGDLVKLNLGPRKAFVGNDPSFAEKVLKINNKNYSKNTPGVKRVKESLQNGIITTWGDEWKRQRKISQQAFKKSKIEAFAPQFIQSAEKTKQIWEEKLKEGPIIDITHSMMRNTLQSAVSTMFTQGVGSQMKEIIRDFAILNEVANFRIKRILNWPLWVPVKENRRYSKANKNLHLILRNIITGRRESSENLDDLMGLLMGAKDEDTGSMFSDEELRYQLLSVLLGGVDTSANTLAFAWYLLAKLPDIAEKVRKEAEIAFSKNESGIQILNDLDYTKRFISEVLRLYPPVPIFGRTALNEDEWNGFKIPKGMLVITSPFVIHRNPKYWSDPEKVDPDRHLLENSKKRVPFAYFPYGGGPRICLGMGYAQIQLPLTLSYLIRHFDFSTVDHYQLKLSPAITIGTKDPIILNLAKREN